MPSPNRPDLSADALWYERAVFMGALSSWMTFGMICVVCLQTIHLLVEDPPRRGAKRNQVLIAFTLIMFSLAVSFIGLYTRNFQLQFIENRNYPGGPMAWGRTQFSSARFVSPIVISVVISWLADGFLIYRCLVIFHFNLYLLALLVALFFASMVSGIFFLNETIQSGTGLYSVDTVAWGLARVILTTVLNIVLAILIAGRLLFFRRSLRRALGTSQALSVPYISIAAMVIESSMICALSFLAFAIPYALNSHVANLFLPSSFIMPVLSTILINMRVASRRAWDSRTMIAAPSNLTSPQRAMTSIEFVATAQKPSNFAAVEESTNADGRGLMETNITKIVDVLVDGAQPEQDKK
ncbi:uncharacterized protein STEHIDRAFT_160176 [Stereum hirsutum FP-91666 SS1]|uniref:uncharacterized protein n=1 Tax=Stereum hirsutum (strain FP-91666) TaxID=721885 RepID=UPI000444A464|nr:uncharacterized protein STEHIDRAFT_160176 [Stereum hirsutum FP-91666 SS1]EIM83598.1 hypothetical protein STEHIDRAFT_160176 [Stereum hirsutum FP-91666 SS1]